MLRQSFLWTGAGEASTFSSAVLQHVANLEQDAGGRADGDAFAGIRSRGPAGQPGLPRRASEPEDGKFLAAPTSLQWSECGIDNGLGQPVRDATSSATGSVLSVLFIRLLPWACGRWRSSPTMHYRHVALRSVRRRKPKGRPIANRPCLSDQWHAFPLASRTCSTASNLQAGEVWRRPLSKLISPNCTNAVPRPFPEGRQRHLMLTGFA